MYLKFADGSYKIENFDIFGGPVTAVANDTAENVLFYTNGCSIFNRQNEIMENGDEINSETWSYNYYCSFKSISYLTSSTITLPLPGRNSNYLLFYPEVIRTSDTSGVFDKYLLTTVDMSSGNGKVVTKNEVILKDSLWDAAAAVRHGNGRDWWLLIARGRNRDFWEIHIDPTGIRQKRLIHIPPPYSRFSAVYALTEDTFPYISYHTPDEYQIEPSPSQITFSPDGSKMCRVIRSGEVEIFDFDRCSGDLTYRRSLLFSPYLYFRGNLTPACGISISPNNRFLYFNKTDSLFQFDMCEENLMSGTYQFIQKYDNFQDLGLFSTNFFIMRDGPDGKIYMTSTGSSHSLHVIEKPDLPGANCQFEQHSLKFTRNIGWDLNYFPNYALYDVSGSLCDTLGIDDPRPVKQITFNEVKLYPNPTDAFINVYIPQCDGAKIKIWNIAGQMMMDFSDIPGELPFPVPTSGLPSGIYIFEVFLDNEKPKNLKVFVTH
jgi:hypothetical protein